MGLLKVLRMSRGGLANREPRILILGLDNAGKTTILKLLASEEPTATAPTEGFNVKSIDTDGVKLNIWDIGGQRSIRKFWPQYYRNTDGIIYVVDAADTKRIGESALTFGELLQEEDLAGVPVLVFGNKIDLEGALQDHAIAEHVGLHAVRDRMWSIQACSAMTGEGVMQGIRWILEQAQARLQVASAQAAAGGA